MPKLITTAKGAELSALLKIVGLNRSLSERAIKVFPSSAWKILIFGGEKEIGGFAPDSKHSPVRANTDYFLSGA